MFKATHKIIGTHEHFFKEGEEVQYLGDCPECEYEVDIGEFVDEDGLCQHVLMSDVEAI